MKMSNQNNPLPSNNFIHVKTWEKDSYGLFDYESDRIQSNYFNIVQNGYLYRNNYTNLVAFSKKEEITFNQLLCQIHSSPSTKKLQLSTQTKRNLPINNTTLTDLQEQIWCVVNQSDAINSNPKKYKSKYTLELKKNDIIKIGRIKFIIKDLNIVNHTINESEQTFIPYETNLKTNNNSNEPCRICLSFQLNKDYDTNNPMISICKCKGTMNLHLNCLKLWLESKVNIREMKGKLGVTYTIKTFNCEICHEPYPLTIKNNDTYYNLLNYNIPEGQNFVILQSLNSVKENAYPLSVHVLMFIENEGCFTMGRGHECDIKISDISVSRMHARIFMKNEKIYMEDMNSKFGTLVLAKEPVDLTNGYLYQIGRTLVFYGNDHIQENKSILDKIKEHFDIGKYYDDFIEKIMEDKKEEKNDTNNNYTNKHN